MPPILVTILSFILSWRTLALVLAYFNLKSLPSAWHVRLFLLVYKYRRNLPKNQKHLKAASEENKNIHPLFRPVSIESSTSMYETDYNLHKSNSTYFADLDHSRTALVMSLLTPSIGINALVPTPSSNPAIKAANVKPGLLFPILGSVHTSFLREIKPFEKYSIRSRLICWDRKWLIIASYFVRPATPQEKSRAKKDDKPIPNQILLACSLSKYVIKQGRRTIEPALALAGSGWFEYPVSSAPTNGVLKRDSIGGGESTGTNTPNPVPGPSHATMETADRMQKVARRLSMGVEESKPDIMTKSGDEKKEQLGGWTFAQIEAERVRGLDVVEKWIGLDSGLREEYEYGLEEGFM